MPLRRPKPPIKGGSAPEEEEEEEEEEKEEEEEEDDDDDDDWFVNLVLIYYVSFRKDVLCILWKKYRVPKKSIHILRKEKTVFKM